LWSQATGQEQAKNMKHLRPRAAALCKSKGRSQNIRLFHSKRATANIGSVYDLNLPVLSTTITTLLTIAYHQDWIPELARMLKLVRSLDAADCRHVLLHMKEQSKQGKLLQHLSSLYPKV
jgi:hypothetical protein